jgi:hypothetical protein
MKPEPQGFFYAYERSTRSGLSCCSSQFLTQLQLTSIIFNDLQANCPRLPSDMVGKTFNHVFGTNTSR